MIVNVSTSTVVDLAGVDAGLDDSLDQVAPLGVELGAVLLDLGMAERLRPQVEPQPPVAGELVLLVGHQCPLDQDLEPLRSELVERSISSVAV